MKRSVKLCSVLLLLITSFFAGANAKTMGRNHMQKTDAITFSSLPAGRGIAVKFKKGTEGKAIIIIYDNDKNVLRKDELSNAKTLEKGYI